MEGRWSTPAPAFALEAEVVAATKTDATVRGRIESVDVRMRAWRVDLERPDERCVTYGVRIEEVVRPGSPPRPGLKAGALVHVEEARVAEWVAG